MNRSSATPCARISSCASSVRRSMRRDRYTRITEKTIIQRTTTSGDSAAYCPEPRKAFGYFDKREMKTRQ